MRSYTRGIFGGVFVLSVCLVAVGRGEAPLGDAAVSAAARKSGQDVLLLPVHVVDADGKPVAKAKVTPWALRSSQGHGWWGKDDERMGFGPQEVLTDENGTAAVSYPKYANAEEQIGTIAVSLYVDHPEFAYVSDLHIDVPLESNKPYEVRLTRGVPVEVRPTVDGKPAKLDDIFAIWSDGRSWAKGVFPEKTTEGTLRIPAMPAGKQSLLLVELDGGRAARFSKITDVELTAGEAKKLDVELQPSLRIRGKLSNNVPRPVHHGRLKLWTLRRSQEESERVGWFTWTPIEEDGTFVIDGWLPGERMQVIALCDGYMAESGKAPDVVQNPPDPKNDFFHRPQVFVVHEGEPIEVAMAPMGRCNVKALDEEGAPIAGIRVVSSPNVGWWNNGSQLYCAPLVRGEQLLREREYMSATDKAIAEPFEGKTDAEGKVTIELPAGKGDLAAGNDVYELPAFLGRRDQKIEVSSDKPTEVTLRLQPRGTEKLGEWDKLAGVVFGCSTREGRRICALPGVRKKMDEFEKRFREAKDQHDPKLLSEAYAEVSAAFIDVGDLQEAAKWRRKSDEEAAKAKAADAGLKTSTGQQ